MLSWTSYFFLIGCTVLWAFYMLIRAALDPGPPRMRRVTSPPPPRLTREDVRRCQLEAEVEVGLKERCEVKVIDGYYDERIEEHVDYVNLMEFGSTEVTQIPVYNYVRIPGKIPRYRTEIRYRDA